MMMDDTLLFIPPCCVDKKLPKAVAQVPLRVLSFHTQADVTMEQFYRAVSYLVIDPHVMVLTMPIVQAETVVFLRQCFERKWITHLVLSTRRNADMFVEKYLSEYRARMLYTHAVDVSDVTSHMVLYTKDRALSLSGPMYASWAGNERMAAYTMVFTPSYSLASSEQDWGNPLRNILFPDVLRHRRQVRKDKRKLKSAVLDRFVHMEFPPFEED